MCKKYIFFKYWDSLKATKSKREREKEWLKFSLYGFTNRYLEIEFVSPLLGGPLAKAYSRGAERSHQNSEKCKSKDIISLEKKGRERERERKIKMKKDNYIRCERILFSFDIQNKLLCLTMQIEKECGQTEIIAPSEG